MDLFLSGCMAKLHAKVVLSAYIQYLSLMIVDLLLNKNKSPFTD